MERNLCLKRCWKRATLCAHARHSMRDQPRTHFWQYCYRGYNFMFVFNSNPTAAATTTTISTSTTTATSSRWSRIRRPIHLTYFKFTLNKPFKKLSLEVHFFQMALTPKMKIQATNTGASFAEKAFPPIQHSKFTLEVIPANVRSPATNAVSNFCQPL